MLRNVSRQHLDAHAEPRLSRLPPWLPQWLLPGSDNRQVVLAPAVEVDYRGHRFRLPRCDSLRHFYQVRQTMNGSAGHLDDHVVRRDLRFGRVARPARADARHQCSVSRVSPHLLRVEQGQIPRRHAPRADLLLHRLSRLPFLSDDPQPHGAAVSHYHGLGIFPQRQPRHQLVEGRQLLRHLHIHLPPTKRHKNIPRDESRSLGGGSRNRSADEHTPCAAL